MRKSISCVVARAQCWEHYICIKCGGAALCETINYVHIGWYSDDLTVKISDQGPDLTIIQNNNAPADKTRPGLPSRPLRVLSLVLEVISLHLRVFSLLLIELSLLLRVLNLVLFTQR